MRSCSSLEMRNRLLYWLEFWNGGTSLVNLDAPTHAGSAENLESLNSDRRHQLGCGDVSAIAVDWWTRRFEEEARRIDMAFAAAVGWEIS
ncbi:MAG: hypothetical protein WB679_04955 [Terracidiphilus sp.]